MGLKEEFKHYWDNLIEDLGKETSKNWVIEYKGHIIEVKNELMEEVLLIDGQIIDQHKRKSIWSHVLPYSKLSGSFTFQDGATRKVSVKIGGMKNLNCIVKVGNETIFEHTEKVEFLPWENKEKLVPYILQQVEEHGRIIDASLPDDRYVYKEGEPKLSPGFIDYVMNEEPTPFFAKKLVKLFEQEAINPNNKTRRATYEHIFFDKMANNFEPFIEQFRESALDPSLIQQEAIWLLENACHREILKFALLVLGFTDCDSYKEKLIKIAMHEEFTAYCLFAIKNGTSNANTSIWQIAKSVHGWGKLVAIDLLDANTPEIKQWILTKGFDTKGPVNGIFEEELALQCAIKGKLDIALFEDEISREIYEGAKNIIGRLIDGNSIGRIDEYPYTGAILSRFIYHSEKHCVSLDDFYILLQINDYIDEDNETWEERFEENWKPHERNFIQEQLPNFLLNQKWANLAEQSLQQNFDSKALAIAKFYKLDVISDLFSYLEKYPTTSDIYLAIVETAGRENIVKLCNFAEEKLPLLLESQEGCHCIQIIVQSLYNYEGIGLPLLKACLDFEDVGPYYALTVLHNWSKDSWESLEIEKRLKEIVETTEDEEDRELAKELLEK